jgi:hypothetical protein
MATDSDKMAPPELVVQYTMRLVGGNADPAIVSCFQKKLEEHRGPINADELEVLLDEAEREVRAQERADTLESMGERCCSD